MRTMARAGPVYRILQDKQDLRCHEDNQARKGQAGRWRDRPSYHAAHRPRRHSHFLGRWTQVSCKEWVARYGMVWWTMVWYGIGGGGMLCCHPDLVYHDLRPPL